MVYGGAEGCTQDLFYPFAPSFSGSVAPVAPAVALSTSTMSSRVLMRQELMRQQAQDQERREAQQHASSAQLRPIDPTPAISVSNSMPNSRPTTTQVPVEVLKVGVLVGRNSAKNSNIKHGIFMCSALCWINYISVIRISKPIKQRIFFIFF